MGLDEIPDIDSNIENYEILSWDLKPGDIISHLKLKHPRYRQTASYGHFGRENDLFTWERIDMVEKLKLELSERNI